MIQTSASSTNEPEETTPKSQSLCFKGIVIHDGFAIGTALIKASGFPEVPDNVCEDPQAEMSALHEALSKAISDLETTLEQLDRDSESHAIFSSHVLMLQDNVLLDEVRKSINDQHKTAPYAWISELRKYHDQWTKAAKGSNMEQRSSDILDIANRVYRNLTRSDSGLRADTGILITEELSASDALSVDPNSVKGVVSERGNDTSHSAILIRSKGIPAIFGVKNICDAVNDGTWIAMDGESGEVYVGYDASIETSIASKITVHAKQLEFYATQVSIPCSYKNSAVSLLANVSSVDQIQRALKSGARGVGLFRTEFLYANRIVAPSENFQFKKYSEAIQSVHGQKIVIRTADFGGDKPISYLKWGSESNPFLGNRGIRYSLSEHSLLRTQIRAILRASAHGDVHIMFPMISIVDEVVAAKSIIEECRAELISEGVTIGTFKIGVMIEVPSAALQIKDILAEVDFVSIGTNDLIQYLMAADRTLDTLGTLTSSFQPSVLRLIQQVIQATNSVGKEVAICGEMAGDTRLTQILLAFGLREFSMSPERISKVKEAIRTAAQDSSNLLETFDSCKTEAEIRALLS